jgi:hypothetical protein
MPLVAHIYRYMYAYALNLDMHGIFNLLATFTRFLTYYHHMVNSSFIFEIFTNDNSLLAKLSSEQYAGLRYEVCPNGLHYHRISKLAAIKKRKIQSLEKERTEIHMSGTKG